MVTKDNINALLKKELIFLNGTFNNQEDFFKQQAKVLTDLNYVEKSFHKSVTEREVEFPTGLKTDIGIHVAIPHTDPEHVKHPFLSITQLTKPLRFQEMGERGSEIDVSLVVVIGFKKEESQLSLLQRLMFLFNDKDFMQQVIEEDSIEDFYEIFSKKMKEVEK